MEIDLSLDTHSFFRVMDLLSVEHFLCPGGSQVPLWKVETLGLPVIGMVLFPAMTVPFVFATGRPQVFGFKMESGMCPNTGMVLGPPTTAAIVWLDGPQTIWPEEEQKWCGVPCSVLP